MVGVVLIVLVLIAIPDHHQSVGYVFGKTINNSGFSGTSFANPIFWFVFGIGLLMAQYTITGYDASAHLSEETLNAGRGAAVGIVMSVVVSVIFGFVLLVAVTFAIPDTAGTLAAGAFDVQYIWQTSTSDKWAEFMLVIACRGAALLRPRLGHVGLAHAVRVLAGRCGTRAPAVAAARLPSRAGVRRRGDLRARVGAHAADAVERRRRLSRRHVDRRDRPVHRVRLPDLAALARRRPRSSMACGRSATTTSGSIRSRFSGSC